MRECGDPCFCSAISVVQPGLASAGRAPPPSDRGYSGPAFKGSCIAANIVNTHSTTRWLFHLRPSIPTRVLVFPAGPTPADILS